MDHARQLAAGYDKCHHCGYIDEEKLANLYPRITRRTTKRAPWETTGPRDIVSERRLKKPATVYFAYCPDIKLIKIGVTEQEPATARLQTFLSWLPFDFYLVHSIKATLGTELEYHRLCTPFRHRGEWYRDEPGLWALINEVRAAT